MFLNKFADTLAPVDMTVSPEFASLLASAADLGISHDPGARYLSRQTVVCGLRLHFLEPPTSWRSSATSSSTGRSSSATPWEGWWRCAWPCRESSRPEA